MTKRKQAAKSVTASTPGALRAKAFGLHSPHLNTGNPSAKKKSKVCKGPTKEGVSVRTASDDLDIDDIFQQARHKKQAPVTTEKKLAVVSKPPRVVGSKDDLFGTGQPKQRRYDAEGLPVYTPEELNVGAGGETDKCPFDCDCCY